MSILAKAVQTTANTEQTIYTVPASTEALCAVSIVNRGTTTAKVRLALLAAGEGASTLAGHLEYDTELAPKAVLERTGLLLAADEKIAVNSDTTTVSYVVIGKADAA